MLVDPNTGMPIGESVSAGNSMIGQVGMDVMNSSGYGPQDLPWYYDVMENIPSATVTTGWNMGRVRNTIINGGTADRRARRRAAKKGETLFYNSARGQGGLLRGGSVQTFGIRHYNKLTVPANIDPTNAFPKMDAKGHSKVYSPFNILSQTGNAVVRNMHRIPGGESLSAKMAGWAGEGVDIKKDKAFAPGTMGRVLTGFDIGRMDPMKFARKRNNVIAAIQSLHPQYYKDTLHPLMSTARYGTDFEYGRGLLQGGVGSTNTGWMSGRVGGFFDAAEHSYRGNTAALEGLKAASTGNAHYAKGIQYGEDFVAKRSATMAKFVGSGAARGVLKGANIASWVLLAHDMALIGGKMVGRAVETAFDAAKSMKGSLDKPVMGMGFKDNSVAATSRQRGVMAISNSRLNMRSALGSEAAAMAAHFG